jgi:hypothetical protein
MKQNYFQYNERLFQPERGITMGFPVSSIIIEVYLKYIKETHVKQWLNSKKSHIMKDMLMIC